MTANEPPNHAAQRVDGKLRPLIEKIKASETGIAAILAGSMIMTNVVALVTTIAFGRLLEESGYGELSAILASFIILSVPGAALQVATAREGALGRLGDGGQFSNTLARWTRALMAVTISVAGISVVLRFQLADVIGVNQEWAAAAVPPAACVWILLSIQRGALQATRAYLTVGISMIAEQTARLLLGVGLAYAGLGVTGAYLGTPLAMVVTAGVLGMVLQSRLGARDRDTQPRGLRQLALDARTAIGGLALIAILQNIDLIVAQHRFDKATAGTYAQVAVAAKVVVWVAIGIGFYLLPEAARKHSENEDARPVLLKALAMTGAVAAPCLLIYSFAPNLLLKLAFGPKYSGNGGQALFELGAAMALLSVCYLAVQLLLALGESKFLIGLAIIAIAEPVALLTIPGENDINGFATTVLVIQAIAASGALIAAYRASAAPPESLPERGSSAVQTPNRATST